MCGRTCLTLNKEQVRCACSYKRKGENFYIKPEWLHENNDSKEYVPSYNIAPTDVTPVLLSASKYKHSAQTDLVLKPMMWGIIPPWHTEDYKSHKLSTNNCRLENINTSKLYSPILKDGGRCVILAQGFYEWKTSDKTAKEKQPYYIHAPQNRDVKIDDPTTWNNTYDEKNGWKGIKLLFMAGLYSVWQNDGTVVYAYSVITMESNSTLDWLHHRMPAILNNKEIIDMWLDIDNVDPNMALSYLKPVKILSWYPVSTAVNNSRNKNAICNQRQEEIKKKDTQKVLTAWFTKTEKRKYDEDPNSSCKKIKKSV